MVGIGYRKDFADHFLDQNVLQPDFIEVAPENWMNIGGFWKKEFQKVTEKYPLLTHGLSLSLGSPEPVDFNFLKRIKKFLHEYQAEVYSEHLSFSKCDNAHTYDLLPIPFTQEAVDHVSNKIIQVQEFLGRKIAIEIVSYYSPVAAEMSEIEFVNAILKKSDAQLLLDVNNIYVNSFNHQYDAKAFINQLPLDRVAYIHMAGHTQVADDLIIDSHGNPIIPPVYDLFQYTLAQMNHKVPVLLERDFNIPELQALQTEIEALKKLQNQAFKTENYEAA